MRFMKRYPSNRWIRYISSSTPNSNVPNKAGQMAYDILQESNTQKKHMESKLAHAGIQKKSLSPLLDLSTTFERPADGLYDSYIYSRQNNPTRNLLEEFMSELEHGTKGLSSYCTAYSSGMAAVSSIVMAHSITSDKVHVILPDDVYHGVPTQLTTVFQNISYSSIDMTQDENIQTHIHKLYQPNLSIILWLETPSNPITKIINLSKICQYVKQIQTKYPKMTITTVVDSTLAPPTITQPIQLGVDLVLHSGTKYLNGHSDAMLGIVTCSSKTHMGQLLAPKLKMIQTNIGAIASSFDSWLTLRGLRTLQVRMERQCQNALDLAIFLEQTAQTLPFPLWKISKVHYPGLFSHPQHIIAKQQMNLFGSILSFQVQGSNDMDVAMAITGGLQLIKRATSLGGTETLIEHRASIEPKERIVSPLGLLRMSVGLEHIDDLKQDLQQAFQITNQVMSKLKS